MCGIVVTAGLLTGETDRHLKDLLIVDSLRGQDSTGIAAIDPENNTTVVKTLGNPFNLFDSKSYDKVVQKLNRAVIGHNRFATQGAVNKRNAHPFEFDTLVGVHNGTLHNKHQLLDSAQFQVDSENLYHHMEQKGIDSLMSTMRGAWSLVWWDKGEETLNFLRNKERPMWIVWNESETVLMAASEAPMLDLILNRSNDKWNVPVQTKVDHHYSFKIGKARKLSKPAIIYKPSTAPEPVQNNVQNFTKGQAGPTTSAISTNTAPKNSRVAPTSAKLVIPSPTSYSGRSDVILEVLAKHVDELGSEYYACFDPHHRNTKLRLYIKRTDSVCLSYRDVSATIGPRISNPKGDYYKVVHGSVKLLDTDIEYFPDSNGKMIDKQAWEDRYSHCDWCQEPLVATANNKFTAQGDCICPKCVPFSTHERQSFNFTS